MKTLWNLTIAAAPLCTGVLLGTLIFPVGI